jgi:hypothetical protein
MKKISVMVLVICLMAGMANAQKIYVRLGLGGGIGLKQYGQFYDAHPQSPAYFPWANETETNNSDNLEFKSMGLGGGLNATLAAGYMLSDHVGIELGVNEFIGLNKKTKYTFNNDIDNYTWEAKLSGKMLQIVPAIVITPGLEKINPYARVGMIIGILPSVVFKMNSTDISSGGYKANTVTQEYKYKSSGGVALGFTGAAGADIMLGEKFAFFAELVFNGITYAPSKGELKVWKKDGVDELPDTKTKNKEWTYEKKYNAAEEIPDSSPNKLRKESFNFSNVELNIGIKMKL